MILRRLLDPARAWLRADPRRRAVAGAAAAALIATAIVVPLRSGRREAAVPVLAQKECTSLGRITPPTATPASEGPWKRIAVPAPASCYTLTASKQDAAGLATDSGFVLEASAGIDPASLAKRLDTSPHVEFSAIPDGDRKVRIQPKAPLAPSALYRFTLLDAPGGTPVRSWAFQTKGPLSVVQTLPADRATEVPLNIGVELTFSHDAVTGADQRFAITPKTDGRFETHKRVLVFVPKALKASTLYTVTLAPGSAIKDSSEKMTQPFTFRFETGTAERTGETPEQPLRFTRAVWESATADVPAVGLFSIETRPKRLPFIVYRFKEVGAFLGSLGSFTSIPSWAGATRDAFVAPTTGLQKVATFNAAPARLGNAESGESGEMVVRFPDRLPAGFYLVRTEFKDRALQSWLQVTDVAAYAAVSERRTVVWANDLAAKAPLSGATVRTEKGDFSAPTSPEGLASFDTPKSLLQLAPSPLGQEAEVAGNLIVNATDGRIAVVPLADLFTGFASYEFRQFTYAGEPRIYWRFLYVDRRLYRPTDAVGFWGLVRHRERPAAAREVVLQLVQAGEDLVTVARTTVKTSPRGTYIGSLPFAGVPIGSYELQAVVDGQVIGSTPLEVEDFVKPPYKIDVTPSRRGVLSGEPVTFDIGAQFFEGSPVPSLELSTAGPVEGPATTDAQGHALVPYTAQSSPSECSSGVEYPTLQVTPKNPEEAEITASGSVLVLPAAVTATAEGTAAADRGRVDGVVTRVDLSRVNAGGESGIDDYRGAPAGGRRVNAAVKEITWRRVEDGQSYDYVSKTVITHYRYEREERAHGSFSTTTDARGRFSFSFPIDQRRSYQVSYEVADDAGRSWRECVFVASGFDYTSFEPTLNNVTEGPYRIGDRVSVVMRAGDADLPADGSNRYLFMLAHNGIRDQQISTAPSYSFAFADRHAPNVEVLAVRFTGSAFQEVGYGYTALFDQASRELRVTAQPDRARYRPGETANLAVSVTDGAGRPVQAEVLLSAIDEALYRISPEFYEGSILSQLYEPVPSGILRVYASHQFPSSFSGAEMGGEGGSRGNFRDVGLFRSVVTDAKGKAVMPFPLPDNLTSWRLSALAVTDALHAGSSVRLIPVGLPVFVDAGMNDSYLTSDKPQIRLRAFGTDLKANDPVSFTVLAPSLSDKPITSAGRAFTPLDVALPPLRDGTHRITVRVTAKGATDALDRTITVIPTRLLRLESRFAEVKAGEKFAPQGSGDRPTTLVLSDHNRGRYHGDLARLSWTTGDRLDQMLARNLAQEMLATYFKDAVAFPAVFHPSRYQTPEGGVAIFPFADADLELSTRAASVAQNRFARADLHRYFTKVLADPKTTRERGIIALAGEAALGEPVLLDVRRLAAERDLSPRERVYLGLAAADLGDEDTASGLYRALLTEFGEVRGDMLRFNVGADQDDVLEITGLAAALGAAIADDAAPLAFTYTSRTSARDILLGLDQIAFLSDALPHLPANPVRVSYTLDGKRQTQNLEKGAAVTLVLSARQLSSLDLEVAGGTAGVATTFLAPFDPKKAALDKDVKLSRVYGGEGNGRVTVEEGDLVRIVLNFSLGSKALDGCYQVTDLLPSGLKPVMRPYARGIEDKSLVYPYAVEGQRVSFCAYREHPLKAFVYLARVVGKGSYTADPALAQSQLAPELIRVTGSTKVEIG